jgi:hypothetical protein
VTRGSKAEQLGIMEGDLIVATSATAGEKENDEKSKQFLRMKESENCNENFELLSGKSVAVSERYGESTAYLFLFLFLFIC